MDELMDQILFELDRIRTDVDIIKDNKINIVRLQKENRDLNYSIHSAEKSRKKFSDAYYCQVNRFFDFLEWLIGSDDTEKITKHYNYADKRWDKDSGFIDHLKECVVNHWERKN